MRHGTVRARVAGLEAVLADGSVVRRMSGLLKDNAGYDLPALLIGSEGTLGVDHRASAGGSSPRNDARALALVPLARARRRRAAAARRAPAAARRSTPASSSPTRGSSLVLEHLGVPAPLEPRAPAYVLLEAAAREDPLPELAAALEAAGVEDAVIADDTASRERLWRLREAHTEAISAAGVPHKLDVGVPLDALAPFCDAVREAMPAGARTILFGHLGDGNVHVNVLGPDPADDDRRRGRPAAGRRARRHDQRRARRRRRQGALPAAHALAGEIAAMRAIKAALDPRGVLNPGAVLERTSTAAG